MNEPGSIMLSEEDHRVPLAGPGARRRCLERQIDLRGFHSDRYDGFGQCMDGGWNEQRPDALMERDVAPGQVWKRTHRSPRSEDARG